MEASVAVGFIATYIRMEDMTEPLFGEVCMGTLRS